MKLPVRAALAGLAAAAVALGLAEIVAVFTGPDSSPLYAVGGAVIDNVPPAVKDFGISVFGTHDKTALIIGTGILLALYAALVGFAALRSRLMAYLGIGIFTAIGVTAALTRHDAGLAAALPSLVAGGAAALALHLLVPLARRSAESGSEANFDARRHFLVGVGAAAGVALVGGFGGRFLTNSRAVTAARQAVVLPEPSGPAPVVPPGAQAPGATAYVTSNRTGGRPARARCSPRPCRRR
ncbi:hypothetical protein [Actinoplanes sp. RD1]|uniref:hypothetical protein n=1 Tax=Actinoplanes sp. RD1 TaxID=3064538 RepID=UPI0027427440|nr:hypothetical protein [Actinoplanes sp. RD1]